MRTMLQQYQILATISFHISWCIIYLPIWKSLLHNLIMIYMIYLGSCLCISVFKYLCWDMWVCICLYICMSMCVLGADGSIPKYQYYRYYISFRFLSSTLYPFHQKSRTVCNALLLWTVITSSCMRSLLLHCCCGVMCALKQWTYAERQVVSTLTTGTNPTHECSDGWTKECRVELYHSCQWTN